MMCRFPFWSTQSTIQASCGSHFEVGCAASLARKSSSITFEARGPRQCVNTDEGLTPAIGGANGQGYPKGYHDSLMPSPNATAQSNLCLIGVVTVISFSRGAASPRPVG